MTKGITPQHSSLTGSNDELPALDFFAPLKQKLTFPENIGATSDDVLLNPWVNGGWRMRVKLASGRYKYSYFIKGEWRSRSTSSSNN